MSTAYLHHLQTHLNGVEKIKAAGQLVWYVPAQLWQNTAMVTLKAIQQVAEGKVNDQVSIKKIIYNKHFTICDCPAIFTVTSLSRLKLFQFTC